MLGEIRTMVAGAVEATGQLAATICRVPAPTGKEGERAALVASLLEERGYLAEVDAIGNVYVRRGHRGGPALMLLAHTDTVFSAETNLEVVRVRDELHRPGIGDNSLGVAAMVSTLQILDKLEIETAADIIAVANVGEEGLGNRRGARAAVERFQDELAAVVAIEGHNLGRITHIAVGSKRWRVTVRGPGGHSWGSFGQPSAIHGLGRIIAAIAEIKTPAEPRTSFNVGIIEGGTSINTIAPVASALIDMRSVDAGALDALATQVGRIIESEVGQGLTAEVETLGERPAGTRDKHDPLVRAASNVLTWLDMETVYDASSTDANIPIGLNIPSLCIGITHGDRGHTVEEYISLPPVKLGLAQLLRLCVDATTLISSRSN